MIPDQPSRAGSPTQDLRERRIGEILVDGFIDGVLRMCNWAGRNRMSMVLMLALGAGLVEAAVLLQVQEKRQKTLDSWMNQITSRLVHEGEDTWAAKEKNELKFDSEFLSVLMRNEPRPGQANTKRFTLGMNIDEESEIRQCRIETSHGVQTPAA